MSVIKKKKLLTLFSIFFCISIYGQDTLNKEYFSLLIESITKTTNIKEYRLIQNRYHSNQIKEQRIIVKLKSDSIDRYWRIGKYFSYYRNGNLKISENIDPSKMIRIDTTYNFYKNGKIRFIIIWDNNDAIAPLVMGPWLPGNYWTIDPVRYKKIKYLRNGEKSCEQIRVFSNGDYVLDGNIIAYQKKTKQ